MKGEQFERAIHSAMRSMSVLLVVLFLSSCKRPNPTNAELTHIFFPDIQSMNLDSEYDFRSGIGGYQLIARIHGSDIGVFLVRRGIAFDEDHDSNTTLSTNSFLESKLLATQMGLTQGETYQSTKSQDGTSYFLRKDGGELFIICVGDKLPMISKAAKNRNESATQ